MACVRSLTLPEARWAVCAATYLRRSNHCRTLSNPFFFTVRRVDDSRVRLHVVFVSVIHPVTSAVVAVVGDGRSGEHLHGRGNKGDVYGGEVA